MQDKWFVYIIECKNGSLYTGIAKDVARRFEDHILKRVKYTSYNPPEKVVYEEYCPSMSCALKRESYIKRLTRKKKLELIKEGGAYGKGQDRS